MFRETMFLLWAAAALLPMAKAKLTLVMNEATERGFLRDEMGNTFNLDLLEPYTSFLSPDYMSFEDDDETVTVDVNEPSSIWRREFGNTVVQAMTNSLGVVTFAEIRRENETGVFIDTTASDVPEALAVTSEKETPMSSGDFFEESPPLPGQNVSSNIDSGERVFLRRRRHLATGCTEFIAVKIAIVYDSEFCLTYGGHFESRQRVKAIVASASLHFERDMCVQLHLTNIRSPDRACNGTSERFSSMNREWACGEKPNYLYDFSTWMARKRPNIRIDPYALIHMFSGYSSAGSLGCAYRGVLCWPRYAYGVEYITKHSNVYTQGIIFAHEVGHNLNARHVFSDDRDYIMESTLTSAGNGFSQRSINDVRAFLESPETTCDGVAEVLPSPTKSPTVFVLSNDSPTPDPTLSPVKSTPVPSPYPTIEPTRSPQTSEPMVSPIYTKVEPVAPAVSNDDPCRNVALDDSWCIDYGSSGGYACFPVSEITGTVRDQGCNVDTLRLARCNTQPVKVYAPGIPSEAEECGTLCLFSGDMFCVNVRNEGKVRLTFRDTDGDPFALNLYLQVSSNLDNCQMASVTCPATA